MPIELTISMHPDPIIIAEALDAAGAEIDTSPGPMMSSLEHLMASIDRAFMEEGPGWEPWSESYAKSYGSAHGPLFGQESILIRTAELIGSTQDPANFDVEFDSISWTGDAAPDYAEFHLTGTSKMPERNFLKVDEEAQTAITRDWTHWLDSIVGRVADVSFRGGAFRDSLGRFAKRP